VPQQSALEYLSHGQIPFFRLPSVPMSQRLPAGTRAVFLGVPFDGGTTYQPGARLAPFHIRRVSALVQGWHPGHRLQVFERAPAVDNVQYQHPSYQEAAATGTDDAVPAPEVKAQPFVRHMGKIGRNDPCPCGSGKKYKHCHGRLT